jgi:hypothetical protein
LLSVWQIGVAPLQPSESVQILHVSVAGSHTGVVPLHAGLQVPTCAPPPVEPPPFDEPPPVVPPPVPPPPPLAGTAHFPVEGSQTRPALHFTVAQGSEFEGPH